MNPDSIRAVGRVPHGSSDEDELLDFSANTNPEIPEGVAEVYQSALEAARSYPPEPPEEYRQAAAEYVGCDAESVVPTPGGMAAIRLAVEVTVEPGDSVLVPAPSFGEYDREVRLQGSEPVFVEQERLLETDPSEYKMVVVCNPNNPTGTLYDEAALRSYAARCRDSDTVLLVDEAFLDFTEQPSLAGTDGVVVARSLTKMFGLPGIRAGFLTATGELREKLAAARQPWNVSTPALSVGAYCLNRQPFVERTRKRVKSERERMIAALSEHFDVFPSDAPFLLFDVGDRDVETLLTAARDVGIAVRDARSFRGLDSHVRVAVRLPGENDRLLEVLTDV